MLGESIYSIKDLEIHYPITGIAWKPVSLSTMDVQSFKAVGSDGRILQWRPKYESKLKTLLVSETNSY